MYLVLTVVLHVHVTHYLLCTLNADCRIRVLADSEGENINITNKCDVAAEKSHNSRRNTALAVS